MDFIINMAPVILVILLVYMVTIRLVFRKSLTVSEERREKVMQMDVSGVIENRRLLWKCIFVLALTSVGFIFHSLLNLEPATVALAGGSLLFLLAGEEPHEILSDVEWPTIFFFVGLFIMVGTLVEVGIIEELAAEILNITEGNMMMTSMFVMWLSAFASAIVDNIPYVATMNPLIVDMAQSIWPELSGKELLHNPELMPVWWSLALGACLGGNATIVGASANVIAVGIAEKNDYKISFGRFALYGIPLMLQSMVISAAYILLRYYVF
jgi:Na+/H+ antiporter NhaD/arsenite permease-like protein